MKNNKLNNDLLEDEIDLIEIIKILIKSKKLIISITLAFLLSTFIYNSFREERFVSSVLLEIGSYELVNGEEQLIEPIPSLVSQLKVDLIYRQRLKKNKLKLDSIEDKLLEISYISPSSEFNKNLLEKTIIFIQDRHTRILSNLIETQKVRATNAIKAINNKINYINKSLEVQQATQKVNATNAIKAIDNRINYINKSLKVQQATQKVNAVYAIKAIDNRIDSINESLIVKKATQKVNDTNAIKTINNEITTLQGKIKLLIELIPVEENNLALLEADYAATIKRISSSPTLQQLIYSYNAKVLTLKNEIQNLITEKDNLELQLNSDSTTDLASEELLELNQEKNNLELQLNSNSTADLVSEELFELNQEKNNLELQLNSDSTTDLASEELFELTQEKENFELQLILVRDQKNTTGPIHEIASGAHNNSKFLLLLAPFLGFFFSVFLVFIRQAFIKEQN